MLWLSEGHCHKKQKLQKGYMEILELEMYYRDSGAELTRLEKASQNL